MIPLDRQSLRAAVRGQIVFDEPLSRHTTLRVGGPVDALVFPIDCADVQATLRWCSTHQVFCRALGGGSNLLVRDGGVRGVLVSLREMISVERHGMTLHVEAGVSTARLLRSTLEWELSGLEFLAGVPGTIGGGLIMNAGTVLGEFKDVTTEVQSVTPQGDLLRRDHAACGFTYRGSAIPVDEIVVSGQFVLKPRARAQMETDIATLRSRRLEREPKGFPNAGSIFKNPPADYAGRLLEQAGLKGHRMGGAQISPVHANWFVNVDNASAQDFLDLIEFARSEVKRTTGVILELEVRVFGATIGA